MMAVEDFYIVVRDTDTRYYRHATEASAIREAKRLAERVKLHNFHVLGIIETQRKPSNPWDTLQVQVERDFYLLGERLKQQLADRITEIKWDLFLHLPEKFSQSLEEDDIPF